MKYKYETGRTVWIVIGGQVKFGVIVERRVRKGKPVYDVRVIEGSDDPVEVVAGAVSYLQAAGWSEWCCYEKKKFAAMEIYSRYTAAHKEVSKILRDAPQYFEDPDALLKHLGQIEI
jgi:hypothetical protein